MSNGRLQVYAKHYGICVYPSIGEEARLTLRMAWLIRMPGILPVAYLLAPQWA